jgi:GNAT superfamily N-acetyltransferase
LIPNIVMPEAPDPQMRRAISIRLRDFNERQAGQPVDFQPLVLLLKHPESEEIIGGLWGDTGFTQLHVDLLFVPEALRGAGLGTKLIYQAEDEARRRGCFGAWLDTFSFQARGFYERLGYTAFGTIEDFPPGHSRIFLKKRFDTAPDAA